MYNDLVHSYQSKTGIRWFVATRAGDGYQAYTNKVAGCSEVYGSRDYVVGLAYTYTTQAAAISKAKKLYHLGG